MLLGVPSSGKQALEKQSRLRNPRGAAVPIFRHPRGRGWHRGSELDDLGRLQLCNICHGVIFIFILKSCFVASRAQECEEFFQHFSSAWLLLFLPSLQSLPPPG